MCAGRLAGVSAFALAVGNANASTNAPSGRLGMRDAHNAAPASHKITVLAVLRCRKTNRRAAARMRAEGMAAGAAQAHVAARRA
jgi:hypothetical protein